MAALNTPAIPKPGPLAIAAAVRAPRRHAPPACLAFARNHTSTTTSSSPPPSTSSTPSSSSAPRSTSAWSYPAGATDVAHDEVSKLASSPRKPLTLLDLLRHGSPPLSEDTLLESANFTLSLLPARLAYRINALRNLPFIVVSNPHISRIYGNYLHSLSTLLPWQKHQISSMDEERRFVQVLADLVDSHTNTIPTLARGFLECRRYISPAEVTRFLDEHLRARIGTRLIAQQHLALHHSSLREGDKGGKRDNINNNNNDSNSFIGVIDTKLQPAKIIQSCESFVGEICDLRYGERPPLVFTGGGEEAEFAHIPMHMEYIITELLKNAFRATIESGNVDEPIEVTIAPAPDVPAPLSEPLPSEAVPSDAAYGRSGMMTAPASASASSSSTSSSSSFPSSHYQYAHHHSHPDHAMIHDLPLTRPGKRSQAITIRIRDRGGGVPPHVLPNIWSYSFTTVDPDADSDSPALDELSEGGAIPSLAGLGYGLPLSRAYADYFGGSIAIQSLSGWGSDVYLTLRGIGMK